MTLPDDRAHAEARSRSSPTPSPRRGRSRPAPARARRSTAARRRCRRRAPPMPGRIQRERADDAPALAQAAEQRRAGPPPRDRCARARPGAGATRKAALTRNVTASIAIASPGPVSAITTPASAGPDDHPDVLDQPEQRVGLLQAVGLDGLRDQADHRRAEERLARRRTAPARTASIQISADPVSSSTAMTAWTDRAAQVGGEHRLRGARRGRRSSRRGSRRRGTAATAPR